MHDTFRVIAERIATLTGTPLAFSIALLMVVVWAVTGPLFDFSDTWQLVINTGTTIVTFLMVFLIQNAQNRDAVAVQLKLDELIRSVRGARMGMINIDQLSDSELQQLRKQFQELGDENGGCEELEATVTTEQNVQVSRRTTDDADGAHEAKEIATVRKQWTAKTKTKECAPNESDEGDEKRRSEQGQGQDQGQD